MFITSINVPRLMQLSAISKYTLKFLSLTAILLDLPMLVNFFTMWVYVSVDNIPSSDFARKVMPNLGFEL
jgi:hypothetical protein